MWPSSSSSRRRVRGFTLLEAMISLLLLVIVLIVAMTMLFQMRAFAERQQYFMLPRQAARRATDYLSYYFAGASDVNYVDSTRPSPNALIMYYNLNSVVTQASYNNLTGAETGNAPRDVPANPPVIQTAISSTNFGDIGTDIITMVSPFNPARYQVFAPIPAAAPSADLFLNFRVGCATSDKANMDEFKAATGFDETTGSALLMLVDRNGSWSYVRIPSGGLGASKCSDVTAGSFKNIHVTADTASATLPAPPNEVATLTLTDPVYLVTGLQVISFRVLTDSVDGIPKLQQKLGLFDPNTDNPYPPIGSVLPGFTNVMENVEDLQIAYVYSQDAAAGAYGLVWNTASQKISSAAMSGVPAVPGCPQATCDNGVPFQAGPNFGATPPALDISNVIGVRFSVTGRSPLLPIGARQLTNIDVKEKLSTTTSLHFRPASEDHAVPDPPLYDQYDHYRATATLMLRNRIPKG